MPQVLDGPCGSVLVSPRPELRKEKKKCHFQTIKHTYSTFFAHVVTFGTDYSSLKSFFDLSLTIYNKYHTADFLLYREILIPFHPDDAALQFHVISPDYSSVKTSPTVTVVSAFLFLRLSFITSILNMTDI